MPDCGAGGYLTLCGSVHISVRDEYSIRMETENVWVAEKYSLLLNRAFKIRPEVAVRHHSGGRRAVAIIYTWRTALTPGGFCRHELITPRGTLAEGCAYSQCTSAEKLLPAGIYPGAFLAAGSVSDPNRSYHFEIVYEGEYQAEQLKNWSEAWILTPKPWRKNILWFM
ncbi:MAG: DNA-binding protein WhiA [Eisenbergiella sp.]